MTLRAVHVYEPDADGDCYRCEFPADEIEVHVPEGEEIVAWIEPRFTSFSEDDWEGGAA